MKSDMPNLEHLVRLLKKRNFEHQFIWGIAMSTNSEELLKELADFIEENDIYEETPIEIWVEENIGWNEFVDEDELD